MAEQFGKIPGDVIRSGGLRAKVNGKPLPPSALAAYIVIMIFASEHGKSQVGHNKIAELAGITRTSAANATTVLIAAGLIRQVKRGGSNAGASVYEVAKCWQPPTLEVSSVTGPSVGNHPSKCRQSPTPSDLSSDLTSVGEKKECALHTPEESGKKQRRVPSPPLARPLWEQARAIKAGGAL